MYGYVSVLLSLLAWSMFFKMNEKEDEYGQNAIAIEFSNCTIYEVEGLVMSSRPNGSTCKVTIKRTWPKCSLLFHDRILKGGI